MAINLESGSDGIKRIVITRQEEIAVDKNPDIIRAIIRAEQSNLAMYQKKIAEKQALIESYQQILAELEDDQKEES